MCRREKEKHGQGKISIIVITILIDLGLISFSFIQRLSTSLPPQTKRLVAQRSSHRLHALLELGYGSQTQHARFEQGNIPIPKLQSLTATARNFHSLRNRESVDEGLRLQSGRDSALRPRYIHDENDGYDASCRSKSNKRIIRTVITNNHMCQNLSSTTITTSSVKFSFYKGKRHVKDLDDAVQ